MDMEIDGMVNLDDYEPVFQAEDDGLVIKAYEIDGEFLFDFDWEPSSKWVFLEDDAMFREFTVGIVERMTGQTMDNVEVEDPQFIRHSKQSGAEVIGGADAACAVG
jgi:hypothetical protein